MSLHCSCTGLAINQPLQQKQQQQQQQQRHYTKNRRSPPNVRRAACKQWTFRSKLFFKWVFFKHMHKFLTSEISKTGILHITETPNILATPLHECIEQWRIQRWFFGSREPPLLIFTTHLQLSSAHLQLSSAHFHCQLSFEPPLLLA